MTDHQHIAETLHRAADLLEERGWMQGAGWHELGGYNGPLCAQGVFAVIDGKDSAVGYRCPAMLSLMTYLGISLGLFSWNDTPGRTASEVIEVLRAAAAVEQAKHDAEQPAPTEVSA